jgi:hypothetical protein
MRPRFRFGVEPDLQAFDEERLQHRGDQLAEGILCRRQARRSFSRDREQGERLPIAQAIRQHRLWVYRLKPPGLINQAKNRDAVGGDGFPRVVAPSRQLEESRLYRSPCGVSRNASR